MYEQQVVDPAFEESTFCFLPIYQCCVLRVKKLNSFVPPSLLVKIDFLSILGNRRTNHYRGALAYEEPNTTDKYEEPNTKRENKKPNTTEEYEGLEL